MLRAVNERRLFQKFPPRLERFLNGYRATAELCVGWCLELRHKLTGGTFPTTAPTVKYKITVTLEYNYQITNIRLWVMCSCDIDIQMGSSMNISGISSNSSIGYRAQDSGAKSLAVRVESEGSNSNDGVAVRISGKALLYSRIFRTTDPSKHLHIETEVGTTKGLTTNKYDYLTKDDRELLASFYDYASESNIDLKHVDILADELAGFRKSGWVPAGDIYTHDGKKITADFNSNDKKIADRIKSSEGFSSTKIDKEFLNRILDSSRPVHAVNFEFLEHLISNFSPEGVPENSAQKFAKYDDTPNSWVTNISDEVDPRFIPDEPDLISINGGPYFKNPKKDTLSNEDFLKSIDTNVVSRYLDIFLESSSQDANLPKAASVKNSWMDNLYRGVKKMATG